MEWIGLSGQNLWATLLIGIVILLLSCQRYWEKKITSNSTLEIAEECSMGSKETQEDAGGAVETAWGTLAVLADGMGKGRSGKMASQVTVKSCIELFTGSDVTGNLQYYFTQAFNLSNKKIVEYLQGNKGGAVAAAVLITKGYLYYAAVGDVKIALLRSRELIPVNDGQTMQTAAAKGFAQGLLDREQALAISQKKCRSNYIGRDGFKNIEMDIQGIKLVGNDVIIVMTRGLYQCLSWVELENYLSGSCSCEKMAEQIIERFNKTTSQDKGNGSLFVMRYTGR